MIPARLRLRARRPRLAVAGGVFLLALGMARPVAAAPKTDTVVLLNGNRITCEIKRLQRALLTLSTDPMDTVSVHWAYVAQIVSPRTFEIEVTSGTVYYGALAAAPDGEVGIVSFDGSIKRLALLDVIRLTPIRSSLWRRIDGSIDLGFSFTQANVETRWTLNSSATYRSPRYEVKGSLASQLTTGTETSDLSRHTLSLSASRFLGQRWFTLGLAQFQQNDELSLDLRTLAGGGFGRYFSQTNRQRLSGVAGVVYTRERFSGEGPGSSAEAVLGGTLAFFSPKDNNFTLTNSVVSFYKLGSPGRARLEIQSSFRYEFFKDFYWSINGYESFDGRPPEGDKRNDAGVTVSLGWTF